MTLSSLCNRLKFLQQMMLPRLFDPSVVEEVCMRLQWVVLISFRHSSGICKLSSSDSVFMSTSQFGPCLHNLQLASSAGVMPLDGILFPWTVFPTSSRHKFPQLIYSVFHKWFPFFGGSFDPIQHNLRVSETAMLL